MGFLQCLQGRSIAGVHPGRLNAGHASVGLLAIRAGLCMLTGLSMCSVGVRGELPFSETESCIPFGSAGDEGAEKSADSEFVPLFNGKDLNGWNGDTSVFRIESEAIVGGNLKEKIPHNYFLSTDGEYENFELRLEFRLKGNDTNAGIQIRSERIPDHHEMIGYQADLGQNYWGCLYDESRRNKVLAAPKAEELARVLRADDWNSYRILCEGNRIQLWINDLKTVDYTEADPEIVQKGKIALQIHGGPPGEAWYRNIRIRKL